MSMLSHTSVFVLPQITDFVAWIDSCGLGFVGRTSSVEATENGAMAKKHKTRNVVKAMARVDVAESG